MSNAFVIIKMCYVHNQWYDISCVTLYVRGNHYDYVPRGVAIPATPTFVSTLCDFSLTKLEAEDF